MTRYQLLKKHKTIVFLFVKYGIINYQVIRDMEIYEQFQLMKDVPHNEAKYLVLADSYDLSTSRIEQIIYSMQCVN